MDFTSQFVYSNQVSFQNWFPEERRAILSWTRAPKGDSQGGNFTTAVQIPIQSLHEEYFDLTDSIKKQSQGSTCVSRVLQWKKGYTRRGLNVERRNHH